MLFGVERKVWTWSMGHMMPKSAERMATTAFGGGGAGRVVGVVGIVESWLITSLVIGAHSRY